MPPPAISIIVPVYNRANLIGRALASIASQTFSDFELIVVDDGSTDAIEQACATVEIPRRRLIRHTQNQGAAAARNTGIKIATGRWLAFLDSDDSWEPDKLARQVASLSNAAPAFRACTTGYRLHRDGQILAISLAMPPAGFRREILFGCTICPGSTLLVDRRVFDEIGPFDEGFRRLEDWDWLLRFAERYDIVFLPELLTNIYLNRPFAKPEGEDFVLPAIDRLWARHLPRLRAQSGPAYACLRSSLYVEMAAHMYHSQRPWRAALYVIISLLIYPTRNAAFFRSLWRSVLSIISRRLGF